uniref:Protein kinase domain-containing protein n=1 Tax=Leptocylindrus danicus TaxID=163516 RepID=A0A7S2P167_9STRA|mmetsp:Transcript_20536/g.30583  ORF Transcript_20536/g.30583 Transcript_20536/m.30583 type:complete len:388 (+) Transcript_20536:575-1738(+)|eukprot:CAMPEP_0116018066 /NCGR_PEP_ID=MMETSP0321-20121206/8424_1 /TAXON_ID=163516 /ORGANISM="Leptocylindrus danicus var. danicus, Strain B650" /LENGTH=387 /DNA_ID=CAMNT_0003488383 /DNA_START=573 /DNA_END=1736 /DNA_ORIENTATION=+
MDELAALNNAHATYDDLLVYGDPVPPLNFPEPELHPAARVSATLFHREENRLFEAPNVVYRDGDEVPHFAYWIQRKLKKAIYGCVRSCMLLKLCQDMPYQTDPSTGRRNIIWEITGKFVAVKIMDWDLIRKLSGVHKEEPLKEIAAMQSLRNTLDACPHVMPTLDVMTDQQYLYSFMPYCSGGELFSYVQRDGRFPEPLARFWFRQLVQGIFHLQKAGICHRDMSLENVLVDGNNAVVIDLGMCLRIPFSDDDTGGVTDVTAYTLRRLMPPQGQCGKPNYMSPEVLENSEPFDGFGVDVWAVGIILFTMLVGLPPWDWATKEDLRFKMIAIDGQLGEMLRQWGRSVSPLATDLLQGILRAHPRDRLTFGQIMDHEWVIHPEISSPEP